MRDSPCPSERTACELAALAALNAALIDSAVSLLIAICVYRHDLARSYSLIYTLMTEKYRYFRRRLETEVVS